MARTATTGQPSRYAAEKLPVMRERWGAAPGVALHAMGPEVWPRTPLPALLGVTANATGPTERYCADFCAIGLYQIPERTWDALRTNATVRRLLGNHDAVPSGDFADHIPDQIATGIVSLRRDLDAVSSRLAAAIRPTEGTQWQLMLAVMAYVVGAQGAASAIAPVGGQLADVSETDRFGTLVQLAATRGDRALVYPVTRAWQRLATGRALAGSLGESTEWYDVAAPATAEVALAGLLYPGGASAPGGVGNGLVLAALAAGVVWYVMRSR